MDARAQVTEVVAAARRPVRRRRVNLFPYLFISPFYVLFLFFGAFPIVFSLYISFHNWTGIHPGPFVGFINYGIILHDPSFFTALVNTFILGVGYIPIMLIMALGLAYMLNLPWVRGRYLVRTICFLPIVTSLVVAALVFSYIFDPQFGVLNALLTALGLPKVDWLGNPALEKPSLIMVELWRWVGYNMVIMLAGLQSIDPVLYEAARVDGANAWQLFSRITIPLMRPIIIFATILSTIGTFNLFDESYILFTSSGGVNQQGLTLGVFIYRTAFQYFKFGQASATAYLVAVFIFALAMIQLWYGRRSA